MTTRPIKLSQIERPKIAAMIYGRPGCGKTVLSTSSQHLRTLLIDVDRGALSAACNIGDEATGLLPTRHDLVDLWEVNQFNDVLAAHSYVQASPNRYDLVVLDTATELQRMVIAEVCAANGMTVPSQREWGIVLTMMDDLCRSFKALGTHMIWTAHEMVWEEDNGVLAYRPAFQGSFKDYYARHFSEIWRYVISIQQVNNIAGQPATQQTVRALLCHGTPNSHGKDRSGALRLWEPPSFDATFGRIAERVTLALSAPSAQGELNEGQNSGDRPDTLSPVQPALASGGHAGSAGPSSSGTGLRLKRPGQSG